MVKVPIYVKCKYCGQEMRGIHSYEIRDMHGHCRKKHNQSPNKSKPKLKLGRQEWKEAE